MRTGSASRPRESIGGVVLDWLDRHEEAVLGTLILLGAGLRALLVLHSPRAFGYVYDFYHQGIEAMYATGRLPDAETCWACYHPPLFYLLGYPLYAIGRWRQPIHGSPDDPALLYVGAIPIIAGAVSVYYSYRLFRLFRMRGARLVLATALVFVFPCLFISSFGLEADILLTAILIAFTFYLTLWFAHPRSSGWTRALLIGSLAGAAAATKYSGLVALVTGIVTMSIRAALGPGRRKVVGHAIIFVTVCAILGSWKYVDNVKKHGTPFFANGPAASGFTLSSASYRWDRYEFTTLRLGEVIALTRPEAPPGQLTFLPVYRSVWGTLHAMAWGDMSFFSDPRRHGAAPVYPKRPMPWWLATSVLLLGFVPTALAAVGVIAAARHKLMWPVIALSLLTVLVYFRWVLAQEVWALKAKYILFLLPGYAMCAVLGLTTIRRFLPSWAADGVLVALLGLILAAHAYLFVFARG